VAEVDMSLKEESRTLSEMAHQEQPSVQSFSGEKFESVKVAQDVGGHETIQNFNDCAIEVVETVSLSSLVQNFTDCKIQVIKVSATPALDDELTLRLANLSKELGFSEDKIIRSGIMLLEIALQAKKEGLKFGAVTSDQPLVSEVVGL
jgi:hypothetical protein